MANKWKTASAVRNSVGLLRVGAKIDMEILRKGKKIAINVVTADPDAYMKTAQTENPYLFGLAFRDFDAQTPAQGHIKAFKLPLFRKAVPHGAQD